jgi:flagellar assembly protein FliH
MDWLAVTGPVPPERESIQYLPPPLEPELQTISGEEIARERAAHAAERAGMEQRIRQAHEAGRQEGRREGELAGREAAAGEVQPVLQKLSGAIAEIAGFRPRLRQEAETDVVRLSLAIARRIVNRELNVDPEAIVSLVRAGMEKLRLQEVVRVRVHSQHQDAVRQYLARVGAGNVEVTSDGLQERGSALIETTRGDLDVAVETQLMEIERGLADRLRR